MYEDDVLDEADPEQHPEGHSEALEETEKARIHLAEAVARKLAEGEAVRRFRGSWDSCRDFA
jgi:hypothetical protein